MTESALDDKTYRRVAAALLRDLCAYFDEWDPDEIEADLVPGALTLTTGDDCKFIVSEQGAHQQMWLATPEQGRRYNYDPAGGTWIDAKDGTQLQAVLAEALSTKLGKAVSFS